jgi:phosphate:Na+ symporter
VLDSPVLDERARDFVEDVRDFIARTGVDHERYSAHSGEAEVTGLVESYHTLKAELLETGARTRVPIEDVVKLLDWLSDVRRCAEQVEKGTRHLASLERPGEDEGEREVGDETAPDAKASSG